MTSNPLFGSGPDAVFEDAEDTSQASSQGFGHTPSAWNSSVDGARKLFSEERRTDMWPTRTSPKRSAKMAGRPLLTRKMTLLGKEICCEEN
ncbi:unnamed protein product [Linum trigynum]|uniref:Uncharacterized protein n=1 Tax=Linum trigynum TaxID=586398 RepID=A0AAV2GH35_9ROSI